MSIFLRLRRRVPNGQAGYTLLELVTVMAILGAITGGITTLFLQATTAEFDMNRRFQAQQTARVATDRMRREIHCANAITPTGVSSSITVTLPAQCPSAGGSQTDVTYDMNQIVAGERYQLRRNSVVLADFSTIQNAFNYVPPVPDTSLGKLTVTLPINTEPSNGEKEWRLVADIVLRNTTR